MAYVDFNALNAENTNKSNMKNDSSSVGFFKLANDKDEAIVRFMHDDVQSFEILGTHSVQVNGKFRRINCIRTPMQPVDNCPICAKGEKIDYRFFIHLLQYVNNPDGSVSVEPKVWERSLSYATKLKEYLNNYGPLSDIVCKIVRHGVAGDMKTDYEIIPNLNKQIYRDDIFVKKTGYFDDFKALGRMVLNKTADEINHYLSTGDFPVVEKSETNNVESNNTSWNAMPTPANWADPDEKPIEWNVNTVPVQTTTIQARPNFGNWSNNNGEQVQRPTRF